MTFNNAYASIDNVMKENTNKNQENVNNNVKENNVPVDEKQIDLSNDPDVQAAVMHYKREDNQRKAALIASLMCNVMFLVTAYAILCYDTTGRLFGQLLGVNL